MASLTRSLVVALSLAAVVAGCGTLPREGVLRVDRAALVVTSSTTPPPDDDPGWTPVSLPDLWRAARRREGIEGWYRLDLALERAPAELWAVYLPRVVMNAAVLVNGRLVGDGGRFAPRVTRNWNRPLLFTVPAGLLAEGGNVVHVRLGTTLSSPGLLSPIAIGPERLLRPAWALRTLQQVTLAQVAGVATFLIALLVSVVYLRRDPAGQYRWFAAAALFWTWTALDTLVRNRRSRAGCCASYRRRSRTC